MDFPTVGPATTRTSRGERSLAADQRFDTLIHFEAGQNWEFQLANGLYEVTVAVGDPANNDGVHTINVEGVNFINAVPDTNNPLVVTGQVTVSDGRLSIDQAQRQTWRHGSTSFTSSASRAARTRAGNTHGH